MKVLQVIDSLIRGGGAEKFVLDLSLALNNISGAEVDVLSIVTPSNNDYVEILETNGINHYVLSSKLRSPKNITSLKNFVGKGEYDVVHVHLFPALYFAALAKSLSCKKFRLIYTEHSTTNKRRNNKIFQIADKYIYRKYDAVVGISDKVKSNLDMHLSGNFVQIINNGIDISNIQGAPSANIRHAESIPEDSIIVTMVSRVINGKDYNTVINALKILPKTFHVLFVGDGPLMADLRQKSNNSGVSDRIHILGLRSDVYSILKDSDIIVLSTHHEGFSIAMLEAMACKKPFVASAVEGIKDLVEGVAELFEYQNEKELASILLTLSNDRMKYELVADNCLNFARKYDINLVAQKYLNVYADNV